jgi:hypothetical protein
MSFLGRIEQARNELAERSADPWRKKVEGAVRGKDAISTTALLDLVRQPANTGTARRLAKVMRAMGFIPIKSRRLMPGGFRGTVARGWARPVREFGRRTSFKQGGKVGNFQFNTPTTVDRITS